MMSKQILFTGASLDVMWALYNRGPLSIGDVPSKSGLDELLKNKLAVPIVDRGETKYAGTMEMVSHYKRQNWKASTKM
ncbi:hypothetical protein pSal_SNUABM02_156 [Salmonella phage pSal-SNUABM-02]|nr:hypothetical protein pSal_SNUABM02_156 [Salmonella phage pSal-SNUABM-02]